MKLAVLGVIFLFHVTFVEGFSCRPTDCTQLQCYRRDLKNGGPYRVYPDNQSYFYANCVVDAYGGGWTVMQRRVRGDIPFNRPWRQYKFGFGLFGPGSDTWLGNEHVYSMSTKKNEELVLRVDVTARDNRTMTVLMTRVSILSEDHDYRFVYRGNASWEGITGNDLAAHNGHSFSTPDHDSNGMGYPSDYGSSGGWWFTNSSTTYLNGVYAAPGSNVTGRQYMTVVSFDGLRPLKLSRMLVRPARYMSLSSSCRNPCANGGSCEFLHYESRSVCTCPINTCGIMCQSRVDCNLTTTTMTTETITAAPTSTNTIRGDHFDDQKDEVTSHVSFVIAIVIMTTIIVGVYLNACRQLWVMYRLKQRRLAARAKKEHNMRKALKKSKPEREAKAETEEMVDQKQPVEQELPVQPVERKRKFQRKTLSKKKKGMYVMKVGKVEKVEPEKPVEPVKQEEQVKQVEPEQENDAKVQKEQVEQDEQGEGRE